MSAHSNHAHCECGHIFQDHDLYEEAGGLDVCHGCKACVDNPGHVTGGPYEQCGCKEFKAVAA